MVDAADVAGSTDYIRKAVAGRRPARRLRHRHRDQHGPPAAAEHPHHTIFCLDPVICPCSHDVPHPPGYLAWVLDNLVEGRVVNQIKVDEEVARWAASPSTACSPSKDSGTGRKATGPW